MASRARRDCVVPPPPPLKTLGAATLSVEAMLLSPVAIGIGIAMTLELKMLTFSIVLGLIQIVLAPHAASLQRGYVLTASFCDEACSAVTGGGGRVGKGVPEFGATVPPCAFC